MKKLLLGSVLSTALLLAACGGETEEDTSSEETDTETTETAAEESEDVNSSVTEDAEEAEVPDEESDDNEEIGMAGGSMSEDEMADPEENSEVTEEKQITEGFDMTHDSLNVSLISGGVGNFVMDEDMAWIFDSEVGDELTLLVLDFTVENTVEEPRDFYLDQATIVTNTGEQVDSELFASSGLQSEMLGAVTSEGFVTWNIPNSTYDEIEWIDIFIPQVLDPNTWDTVAEEQKIRVEFE